MTTTPENCRSGRSEEPGLFRAYPGAWDLAHLVFNLA